MLYHATFISCVMGHHTTSWHSPYHSDHIVHTSHWVSQQFCIMSSNITVNYLPATVSQCTHVLLCLLCCTTSFTPQHAAQHSLSRDILDVLLSESCRSPLLGQNPWLRHHLPVAPGGLPDPAAAKQVNNRSCALWEQSSDWLPMKRRHRQRLLLCS